MAAEAAPLAGRSQTGFTLIEALVSMALLTVALIPVFWQSTQALVLSTRVKNTMTASNLAQEGLELARAVRDANWLASAPRGTWEGLDGCENGCEVAFDDGDLTPLSGGPRRLRLVSDPGNPELNLGLYQYDDGEPTPFTRVITVTEPPGSPFERVVASTVAWREKGEDREVALEYHLFDWLQ